MGIRKYFKNRSEAKELEKSLTDARETAIRKIDEGDYKGVQGIIKNMGIDILRTDRLKKFFDPERVNYHRFIYNVLRLKIEGAV